MKRERVTIRKHGGDDIYSWAVFLDGRVIQGLTGLGRDQARYHRDEVRKQIAQRTAAAKS